MECTEVRFGSFLSGGFITAIVLTPPERKLAKCTYVERWKIPLSVDKVDPCILKPNLNAAESF
jgi:hypothetical protein